MGFSEVDVGWCSERMRTFHDDSVVVARLQGVLVVFSTSGTARMRQRSVIEHSGALLEAECCKRECTIPSAVTRLARWIVRTVSSNW